MKHLMTALFQQIDGAHAYKTYNGQATQDAVFPYVVYKLTPVAPTESNRDDYMLEVSCWDKSESTSHARVLEIAGNVRSALTDFQHLDDHNLMFFSRPNLGYIPDPDEMIKRYDVTAITKTYRR